MMLRREPCLPALIIPLAPAFASFTTDKKIGMWSILKRERLSVATLVLQRLQPFLLNSFGCDEQLTPVASPPMSPPCSLYLPDVLVPLIHSFGCSLSMVLSSCRWPCHCYPVPSWPKLRSRSRTWAAEGAAEVDR